MRKLTRTISGVTPVAVMTKPGGCPGQCVYCPTFPNTPRSYTPQSPAVKWARPYEFDAASQVRSRVGHLEAMGHPTDKVEIIIMGGTFLAEPVEYQVDFIRGCYEALNGQEASNLEEALAANEIAQRRCVGLTIETRPDFCGEAEIKRMLSFGCTRVELGVQTLDDDIYRLIRRGHGLAEVVEATRRLRQNGLKVHYHWMTGLPGSTAEKDLEMSRRLFEDPALRPDGLKLYPTLVVTGTELEGWYREGHYQPYPMGILVDMLAKIKSSVPEYVRISRLMRDIPSQYIVAGPWDSRLREMVRARMEETGMSCHCIRCREYGHRQREGRAIGEPKLKRLDYEASGGKEIFLSFEDEDSTLFGILRLRLEKMARVRELHVFGPEVPLGTENPAAAQHRGLGEALLSQAETIARDWGASSLSVLSGVGAKEYYRGLGYASQDSYMVKELHKSTK
ncbi:MAG: tRNA uridine(34) 5-carboxymethylaminomethyl modification radical SAM/GNAT enzyme Elp3 [Chloroflexi bacterium]|nr:tRNA uridine(34) 5-carboxymethylaminomethyl modification radical SAM/GNAT enzyme Elp3 [Chloroflexota bacterium]